MKFTISREIIFKPLQRIVGAVEKRQTLPILSNVLIIVKNQLLSLIGTDLELEIVARLPLNEKAENGEITVSARKLMDICRALQDNAVIQFLCENNKVIIKSGRSRFNLACLPADDFPKLEDSPGQVELAMPSNILNQLFEYSSFAMAQQDVRYYLNGLLITFSPQLVRSVSTDGHRLATVAMSMQNNLDEPVSVIIPRKAVLELQRLFGEENSDLGIVVSESYLKAITTNFSFSTKLVEGKFPNYQRVLPHTEGYIAKIHRESFKQALARVAVLFTDKFKGARLNFSENTLSIQATNSESDEVEEYLEIDYSGPQIEIGFNISYLQEYVSVVKSNELNVHLYEPNSSVLFQPLYENKNSNNLECDYVVMPMRI